jgi:hypothetical protein
MEFQCWIKREFKLKIQNERTSCTESNSRKATRPKIKATIKATTVHIDRKRKSFVQLENEKKDEGSLKEKILIL